MKILHCKNFQAYSTIHIQCTCTCNCIHVQVHTCCTYTNIMNIHIHVYIHMHCTQALQPARAYCNCINLQCALNSTQLIYMYSVHVHIQYMYHRITCTCTCTCMQVCTMNTRQSMHCTSGVALFLLVSCSYGILEIRFLTDLSLSFVSSDS